MLHYGCIFKLTEKKKKKKITKEKPKRNVMLTQLKINSSNKLIIISIAYIVVKYINQYCSHRKYCKLNAFFGFTIKIFFKKRQHFRDIGFILKY